MQSTYATAFEKRSFNHFIDGYRDGRTPNPCVVCNRHIRWGALYEQAQSSGADYLATGHYAQIERSADGPDRLLKGNDSAKDQSYVLSVLNPDQLKHSLFPVGEFPKAQVRELALKYNLKVASRPDSQDLCFLAGQDYRDFLKRNSPESIRPGSIQRKDGSVLGEHQGLAFYTIGQRKGLGLSSPDPMYVIRKDAKKNLLIIGDEMDLGSDELIAGDVNWLDGKPSAQEFDAEVKIRYKAKEVLARIFVTQDDRVRVKFQAAVTRYHARSASSFLPGECLPGWWNDPVLRGKRMTIPAVLFGFLVSTFMGAAFHLWKNGGLGRLLLYLILAWVGFWAGHILAQQLGWTFFSIGPLRFGMAMLGCALLIGIGYWFSLVRPSSADHLQR